MADTTEPDPLLERALEYVTAHGEGDTANVTAALAEARAMVDNHIGSANVPDTIKARAYIEVTAELFHRKNSRNGVSEFASADLQPFRIRNDPMKAAYPFLKPFLPGGFA